MDKNFKISLAIFLVVSVLTLVTFKDTLVIGMFSGMVVLTIISIIIAIRKKRDLSCEVIYISWLIVCNLFTLGFKYIANIDVFEGLKEKIVNFIFMGLPSLFLFYIAKSAARAKSTHE